MIDRERLRAEFVHRFSSTARLFRAPGRVNLIGEHTDYNEGFVLPMAINREVAIAAGIGSGTVFRVHSLNMDQTLEFDTALPYGGRTGTWIDYVEGVVRTLISRGFNLNATNLLIDSDVPVGSGLSSSAAIEMATGFSACAVSGTVPDPVELALAGQQAEHDYVGARVGIMDQMISACGRRDNALLIDCRSLERTQIPVPSSGVRIVICDSRVKHEIATSAYNERRTECELAVETLRQELPSIKALRDVTMAEFERHSDLLHGAVKKRARHIISENARTLDAAASLERHDFGRMGELMYASHNSLRDDFEVSCAELDLLVESASNCPGVLGARMTGGGFGGCTVNLVSDEFIAEFQQLVTARYRSATGETPLFYVTGAENGVEEVV